MVYGVGVGGPCGIGMCQGLAVGDNQRSHLPLRLRLPRPSHPYLPTRDMPTYHSFAKLATICKNTNETTYMLY